jgi:hypothetical protein
MKKLALLSLFSSSFALAAAPDYRPINSYLASHAGAPVILNVDDVSCGAQGCTVSGLADLDYDSPDFSLFFGSPQDAKAKLPSMLTVIAADAQGFINGQCAFEGGSMSIVPSQQASKMAFSCDLQDSHTLDDVLKQAADPRGIGNLSNCSYGEGELLSTAFSRLLGNKAGRSLDCKGIQ